MRINESRIRRIIREEARRVLREGTGGLEVQGFEWDDLHNDGGARTQGGELTINFSAGDMTDMKATKYITSYIMSEKGLLEDLTDEINSTLEQNDLPSVSIDDLRSVLGSKLGEIMRELEKSEDIYQRDAAEADRYGGGGGDFYESRRRRGSIVESRKLERIVRAETLRIIRESEDEEMDDGGEFEDEEMTVQGVIERYKDEGARSWMRVSNDFHEMADGGMEDIREKYYPGLTADDCAMIARTLDLHFGMAF